MAIYEVTVNSNDYQSFDISVDNISISVKMRWNLTNDTWVISITDGVSLLVSGRQVRINKDLLVNATTNTQLIFKGVTPTRYNLGDTVKLYLITEE